MAGSSNRGRRVSSRSARWSCGAAIVALLAGGMTLITADPAGALTATVKSSGVSSSAQLPVALDGGAVAFVAGEVGDLNGDGDGYDYVPRIFDPDAGTTIDLGIAGSNLAVLDGGELAFATSEWDEGVSLNVDGDTDDYVLHVYDPATGTVTNVGMASYVAIPLDGGGFAFDASEQHQGQDLNGDGDTDDNVLHVYDPVGGTTNVGVADGYAPFALDGGNVAFLASESHQGASLNGDGDTADLVPHVYDPATGVVTNVGVAAYGSPVRRLPDGRLLFFGSEVGEGADYNGDGDSGDNVLQVYDPATGALSNVGVAAVNYDTPITDNGKLGFVASEQGEGESLNGDSDTSDYVLQVYDPDVGTVTNVGLAASWPVAVAGGFIAFPVSEISEGTDLNGDGDVEEGVVHVYDTATGVTTNLGAHGAVLTPLDGGRVAFTTGESYQRMDLNGDGDVQDAVVQVHDPTTGATTNAGIASDGYELVALDDGKVEFRAYEGGEGIDLNGDGDMQDFVVHVHDPVTGETANVGIASVPYASAALHGGGVAFVTNPSNILQVVTTSGDAQAPVVSTPAATPNPVALNSTVTLTAAADDSSTGGSTISAASYSLDGGAPVAMAATDGAFDEPTEAVRATIPAFATPGTHEVCVTATDAEDNASSPECALLAAYDASAGFVTGVGAIDSPPGAYTPADPTDPDITGRARFGFVAKYAKGARVPDGTTDFELRAAGLDFRSTTYAWLVVSGSRAQLKGTGTLNGSGSYTFLLTAIDGDITGGGGTDRLRMKIWNTTTGTVVYDNKPGASDTSNDATALTSGSIVIHTAKK